MANTVDLKLVIKHIINGTLAENLCRICLQPLDEYCENMFTKICREDEEYCVADILETVCRKKFSESENDSVCATCFVNASLAYKFYLLMQQSDEVLNFCVDELGKNINNAHMNHLDVATESICISVPEFTSKSFNFDFDVSTLAFRDGHRYIYDAEEKIKTELKVKNEKELDENILIIMNEKGEPTFYKSQDDGTLLAVDGDERVSLQEMFQKPKKKINESVKKKSRVRLPMTYRRCSQCPVKYRFLAKLKEHMKTDHNVDLFVCKACNKTVEGRDEFEKHLDKHTGHTCPVCGMTFKKLETVLSHIEKHESMKNISSMEGAHICEVCGHILTSEDLLKDHYEKKHNKKYTCYYCGRMYKGEISFNLHIQKHEKHLKNNIKDSTNATKTEEPKTSRSNHICSVCGKNFVDERSLMWHQRLHTNERPYKCKECGRAFVSLNRRNQHWACAHAPPARRCPLCPALFHLRSMVNTHVKKVHLKTHKRRNRASKYQEVSWRTETVPIQELSIAIQNDLWDLKTQNAV